MQKDMLCWPLFGVGFEELGHNHEPCTWEIPRPGPDQLLVEIEAIGLCFSDVKLVRAGQEHPRVVSADLASDPVIPGHEAVMRIVEVGAAIQDRFQVGSRYIIQADIYVNGVNLAYGYAINGGMAQYSLIDQRVLSGDEGCYLLPISEDMPAALAALIEPWTCVIASYMIEHRAAPKAGGRMLVAMQPGSTRTFTFGSAAAADTPAIIECLNVNDTTLANLKRAFPDADFISRGTPTDETRFDDIVLCELDRERAEMLGRLGAKGALISFVGDYPDELWAFDVGRIHYQGWFYQGSAGTDIAAAYGRNVRSKLRKGGACWLVGGAGAMGQMHTQLAVEDENGPSRILVTDLDSERIGKMLELLGPAIEARGIELETLNPKDFTTPAAFNEAVRDFAPDGFDDVVMLVPAPPVVTDAVAAMGKDCLMNIFAGIPAGKEGHLNVRGIAANGARFVGSSGSRTYHLKHTLEMVECGVLNTATALAALGGMRALWDGLNGVGEARFPGKTVILPHCEDMPLVAVEDLIELVPGIDTTLSPSGLYTIATERALFERFRT